MTDTTPAMLRELLDYSPDTGIFVWRVSIGAARAGTVAGTSCRGYCRIMVFGKRYSAHRLAWLFVHGEWPKLQIDHINGKRSDNRIANLREATNAENGQNQLGRGVSRSGKRWEARIRLGGPQIRLGSFDTQEEAHAAYLAAKLALHRTFATGIGSEHDR